MIGALIVAFESPGEVERLIGYLRAQTYPIDEILVVDNGRKERVLDRRDDGVKIIRPAENVGVAGAFALGMGWSRERGHRFLWVFDQDSVPAPDTLEKLVGAREDLARCGRRVAVVAPEPRDIETGTVLPGLIFERYRFRLVEPRDDETIYSCDAVIASGSLIDIELTRPVPLPEPELFMDGVDWRFCMSCRSAGLEVVVIREAALGHRLGGGIVRTIPLLGRAVQVHHYSPIRYFYISRNHTFVEMSLARSGVEKAMALAHRMSALLKLLVKISLFEREEVLLKWRMCLTGFLRGASGRI